MDRTPAQAGSGRDEKRARRQDGPGRRRLRSRVGLAAPPRGGAGGRGPERGKRQGEDRVLSLPNAVTTVRLVLIPVFVWLLAEPRRRGWFAAAVLLGALGMTDGLDGQLARRLGQVTNLGKVLDTVADRVLLATAVVGTLAVGAVPVGIAVATIAREGVVATSAMVLALAGAPRIDVVLLGKAGTFGLMCAFPLFLAGSSTVGWHHVATVLAWVAAVAGLALAWASLAVYAPRARAAVANRHNG
ncbi:MAG: CDP-alcohol phosphatidyltransferase family protein [Actinomycetota bacterium]|nr:CDP-alcohol phosphatidyltransferase family protein [Actinomycetota bacterium]